MMDCIINSTTCETFDFFPTCSEYFSTFNLTASILDYFCVVNYDTPLRDASLALCASNIEVLCYNIPLTLSTCGDIFTYFGFDLTEIYEVCEPYTTTTTLPPTTTTLPTTTTTLPTTTMMTTTTKLLKTPDVYRDNSAGQKEFTWVMVVWGLLALLYLL